MEILEVLLLLLFNSCDCVYVRINVFLSLFAIFFTNIYEFKAPLFVRLFAIGMIGAIIPLGLKELGLK